MLATIPFSVVMLPDTQKYTDHVDSSGNPLANESQIYFDSQTHWIANNRAAKNIKFVTHVGDVIEYSSSATERARRWARADTAMDILDGNLSTNPDGLVPYAVVLGNHDYETNSDHRNDASGGAASFMANFGPARLTKPDGAFRSWYGGASPNGTNSYQYFSSEELHFLHIALEFEARNDANASLDAVEWAQSVLDAHPGMPTIISTHAYLDAGESRSWGVSNSDTGRNGEAIFNELVRVNPEVFMVMSGHFTGARQRVVKNAAGFDVYEVLVDYQGDSQGGGGYFRLFEFKPDDNVVSATSISNVSGKAPLANSTSRENSFNWEIDFKTRIAMETTARLTSPLDNGSSITTGDVDSLDTFGEVRVTNSPPSFVIQLADVDDGINDSTVTASTVRLYRDGLLLGQGATNGYNVAYNSTANTISLTPRGSSVFGPGSYQIMVGSSATIRNGVGIAMMPATINIQVAASAATQVTKAYDVGIDTWIQSGMPAKNSSPAIKVDGSPTIQGLIRFPNLTSGVDRIPSGSMIHAVALDFSMAVDPEDGGGTDHGNLPALHRMIASWSDTATWAGSFGGNGISANGSEAASTADASRSANSSTTAPDYDSNAFPALKTTVQGWVNGTSANNGWALLPTGSSGISLGSFQSSSRPKLTVTYTPPGAAQAAALISAKASSADDSTAAAAPDATAARIDEDYETASRLEAQTRDRGLIDRAMRQIDERRVQDPLRAQRLGTRAPQVSPSRTTLRNETEKAIRPEAADAIYADASLSGDKAAAKRAGSGIRDVENRFRTNTRFTEILS